jgi:hypothetical protein
VEEMLTTAGLYCSASGTKSGNVRAEAGHATTHSNATNNDQEYALISTFSSYWEYPSR